jgi:hypothetical protein
VSGFWKIENSCMLDYSIELRSFSFLQRAKSINLASKNKDVVGVALMPLPHFRVIGHLTFLTPN